MKPISRSLAAACLAIASLAVPASAQVQGNIAIVNAPGAIIGTNAFSTAYQQIGTTYKLQIDTIQQREAERQTLLQQLDTNKDSQLDEAEQSAAQNTSQAKRIQQIEQEVSQLSNQVQAARIYAIEQIMAHYGASLQQVVQQLKIQMVVSPDSVIYAPEQADVTQQVVSALNSKVTGVNIVPPQGWQPRRNSVAMSQQVSQILQAVAIQQAQQQAAQQQTPQSDNQTPSGR